MFGGATGGGISANQTWGLDGGVPTTSSATAYGVGCGTPALAIASIADPVIGTTVSALISNTPTSLTGVGLGIGDTFLGGLPILPIDLSVLGMSGCQLLQSNDAFGLPTTTLTASTAQFDFAIPFALSLIGVHVYAQAYTFAPATNALQVIASNGIDWTIGNQ